MRAVDIIHKKREGLHLTKDELTFLIDGYGKNAIPDYQMSAFLMACYFNKPDFEETLALTNIMLESGKVLDLSAIPSRKIDKHSTGGVGDKTSLVIAPLVASCGVTVPMISGRSLGHTGGTLDKLAAIPGFNTNISTDEFQKLLKDKGLAMMGQTPEIAPVDKKMYALRDVTATIECIPLIGASIMSKKLAEGTDGVVLDVKFGSGAFMQKLSDAQELAEWLVKIGRAFDKNMIALLTDMNQPLGCKVGNSLEVAEAVDVLKGEGPKDLVELCIELSAHMIWMGDKASDLNEAKSLASKAVKSGKALEKFQEMVEAQGGNPGIVSDRKLLPQAKFQVDYKATSSGYIENIDCRRIGVAATVLGAGRSLVTDVIDPAVGFTVYKRLGEAVQKGETLLTVHYNDENKRALAQSELNHAYQIGPKATKPGPLIRKVIGGSQ